MNHDKVVNFIDVDLAELVPEEKREELLTLHYATIRDALERGRRVGIAEVESCPPTEPEFPPNEIIKDVNSLPAVLLVATLVAAMFATAIILLGAGLT